VPILDKLPALVSFLKKHPSEKIIIFFTTCNSVKYHAAMFRVLDVPCSEIHGKLVLEKNLHTFAEFKNLRFLLRQMLRVGWRKKSSPPALAVRSGRRLVHRFPCSKEMDSSQPVLLPCCQC